MATGRKFSRWGINAGHHYLPTWAMFKGAAGRQHGGRASRGGGWVNNDVPHGFPTLKNFYQSPFSKWSPQYRTNSTGKLNLCGIVAAILKMATARNFSMSGIKLRIQMGM
jgi:hypothetical protein